MVYFRSNIDYCCKMIIFNSLNCPKMQNDFSGASQHKRVHLCKISEKNIDDTITQSDYSGQKCK